MTARGSQRIAEFKAAVGHLSEAVAGLGPSPRVVERAGIVQLFELSMELGWKSLAKFLENQGVSLPVIAPQPVIRQAFQANIIDGEIWMEALRARNIMSHAYDVATFDRIVADMEGLYLPLLRDLAALLPDDLEESRRL